MVAHYGIRRDISNALNADDLGRPEASNTQALSKLLGFSTGSIYDSIQFTNAYDLVKKVF